MPEKNPSRGLGLFFVEPLGRFTESLQFHLVSGSILMMLHSLLGYFDPGSGSILLQVVVGGFAGAALLFRYAWDHLRTRFSRSGFDPNRSREAHSEHDLEV
jgi:hypothetical protein